MSTVTLSREGLRLGLLALAATCIGLFVSNLWTREAWLTPTSYSVDALETLARFQVAAEQGPLFHADPVVERLGAPWGADWSGYPLPDGPWYAWIGFLAGLIGLMPASNLALLLAHVISVLAFYGCARVLRHRPVIAAAAALVFGFSYSIFHRGLSHHSFALAFTVPPSLLIAWAVGAGSRLWRRRGAWVATGLASAAIGTASPYFVFLFAQLVGFALLFQAATRRDGGALKAGAFALLVCGTVFVAAHFPALRAGLSDDPAAELVRDYAGSETYGLKIIDLFIPPPSHRSATAADLGRLYAGSTSLRGELFNPYLGVVGLAALALMAALTVRRWVNGRGGLRPAHAALSLWIVVFAAAGGINSLLALGGLDHFRAGNRYSIHLLAVVLLFASAWASRRLRLWSTLRTSLLALPVVVFALWDQTPPPVGSTHRAGLRAQAQADREAGAFLEAALPAGSWIFQLPATPFPEAGSRGGMGDYEHFRLLLGSNTLHFSYGALGGSRAQGLIERTAALPAPDLVATLERWGFDAVVVDRRAYPDRADGLLGALKDAGRPSQPLAGRPELALVVLQPSRRPEVPDATLEKYSPAWSPTTLGDTLSLHVRRGWFGLEQDGERVWRWAGRRAVMVAWNEAPTPQRVRLSGQVQAASPGRLTLRLNNEEVHRWDLQRDPVAIEDLAIELPSGASRLEWAFDGRLIRSNDDPRALGFNVENLAITAQ